MENLNILNDLLIEQIRELYNAEKQQRIALEDMKQLAHTRDLKMVIQNHLVETEHHIIILQEVFRMLDITSNGEYSTAMKELIKEGYVLMDRSRDPEISDIGLVTALQYIEHFEIAGYGTAWAIANKLELCEVANQLQFILNEEKRNDQRLNGIAYDLINRNTRVPLRA